jgi:hypothetical protein
MEWWLSWWQGEGNGSEDLMGHRVVYLSDENNYED